MYIRILLLCSLLASPFASLAQDDNVTRTREVTDQEKLLFNQKLAAANMVELEERMFQLAELIRESEPDNATRLLMALKQSRKDLIVESMNEVQKMIKAKKLTKALDQEKHVLRKLKELRELLVSIDLDFKIKLERLKNLQAALKQLDKVIEEEGRQAEQSGEMSKGDPNAKDLDQAKSEQEQNRNKTGDVAEKIKEAGGAEGEMAQPGLNQAKGNMSDAEGSLGQGKPGSAQQQQEKALENLRKARKALKKGVEDLKMDLDNRLRAKVMQALAEMLEKQVVVRTATEDLGPKAEEGDPNALFGVKRLAKPEQEIADLCKETVEMIENTDWSYALPPILHSLHRRMNYVTTDLKAGRADAKVVTAEKKIEDDLKMLLETMNDIPPSDPQEARSDPGKAREREMNLLLAELRILRMLQFRVNEETLDVDGQRARAELEMTQALKDDIGEVKNHQYDVYKATAKLHYELVDPSTYFQ